MFCPKCKAEYREGFSVCSDCNVPLTDTLNDEIEENVSHDPMEFVTIITTTDYPQLAVIKSILEGAEIPYITKGEEILGIFPGLPTGKSESENGGIVAVRVQAERAEEARQLLVEIDYDDSDDQSDDED